MSEEFLTRRQLREAEAAAAALAEAPTPSRRELRDRERAIQERLAELQTPSQPVAVEIPVSIAPVSTPIEIVPQVQVPEFISEPEPFVDGANPGTIPTQLIRREISTETNSIILPTLPDITGSTFTVPSSNIVVRTGSIELATQSTPATGEITLVTAPQVEVDASRTEEISEIDTGMIGVVGIKPIPARSLPKRNKERVFPGRLRKGWGTVYLVLAVAVVMAAIGALVFMLFTSKII